jgi:hypothetical protein
LEQSRGKAAAEQALAPDAAARPQDRTDFGIQMHSSDLSIYQCGAGEARAVGRILPISHLFHLL